MPAMPVAGHQFDDPARISLRPIWILDKYDFDDPWSER
jgi:hypothetical protein